MVVLFKIGFGILTLFAFILLITVIIGMLSANYTGAALAMAAVSTGFFLIVFEEWNGLKKTVHEQEVDFVKEDFLNFISVAAGAYAAYILSIDVGLTAVMASGLVGILATLIFPEYDTPIFCGSFVGMASSSLLPGYLYIGLAGVIAGGVYVIGKLVFKGFGGKLGTTAFIGCVLAAVITGQSFSSETVITGQELELLLVYSVLGAVGTFIISVRLDNSAVISSAAVGVLGAAVLPAIYPEFGNTLAIMVYCASFAGMASLDRIKNELLMAAAGIICAIVFSFSSPYLGGAGGKLGTIAFLSVITINGLESSYVFASSMFGELIGGNKTREKQSLHIENESGE